MENKRSNSIDLLKTICMFGILILHFLLQGGILNNLQNNKINFSLFWLLEILFMCSVNIFAIISGFLYIEKKKYNNKNIVNLIITVVFYSIITTSIFYIFNLYNFRMLGIKKILTSLFPPTIGRYWYITSYILLFFMIPYINQLISSLNKRKYRNLIFILTCAFCVFSIFITKDILKVSYGYSPIWLMYCYLLGGYIKKYGVNFHKKMILSLNINLIMLLILKNISVESELLNKIFNLLISYNSPFIVLNSLIIFLFFKDKNITKGKRLISYLSITSFGVYIIHCHPLIYDYILKNIFNRFFDVNSILFIVIFVVLLFFVYIICSLIEFLKIKIFKMKLFSRLEQYLTNLIDKKIGYDAD